jgi:hypothetical protein
MEPIGEFLGKDITRKLHNAGGPMRLYHAHVQIKSILLSIS